MGYSVLVKHSVLKNRYEKRPKTVLCRHNENCLGKNLINEYISLYFESLFLMDHSVNLAFDANFGVLGRSVSVTHLL